MEQTTRDAENRRRNLGFFFDGALARTPDKVAIIDLHGGRERHSHLPHARCAHGRGRAPCWRGSASRPGERVGMLVGNRVEFIEFFFGAMRAGAIPVPLNTRLAADTLGHIFADAGCTLALVDPGCNRDALAVAERRAAAPPARARRSASPAFSSFEDEMARPAPAVPPPPIGDDTQAFQPYTSGSTGRPKGAIMTHRGMLWYVAHNQQHWPASPDDRGLVALPLFHKNALRGTVKPMLHAGGSFVLMPAYEPRAYLEALAKYRCTYSRGVAAVFTMVLQHRDLFAHARSQCAAQPVDRIGRGDAGVARRRRARAAGREDVGKLRPHRRRQPVPRAARRPAGAARQRRRRRRPASR